MSESNLGTAVLSLRVETGPALAALKAFRAQVEGSLGAADTSGLFKGVESDARAAGEKAGKALADGIKKQTKELKFGSFQQALDFTPKNSIKGLEDYARALRDLRDKTDLTAAGTQQLTDRLGAVDAALRQARRTTAETTAEQRRFNEALDKVALQRFSEQARGFAAGLKEQARAAAANADQFRKMREQAEGAAKAVASLAAKGVGEALKVPVFGLPKNVTGTFDKARAQIERLQQQAETASGKVARLSEGVAVLGAGGVAAKGVIDVLGGIGTAAADTTGILNQVQQALASLPGPLKGLGGLDEVFSNGAQAVANWAASILQAQGELSTLAVPLEAVTNSLGALGPEAIAVGGALAFTFAGFQDLIAKSFKPGVDGARAALKGITADTQALLEALARASEASKGIASLQDLRIAEKDATARVQAAPAGTPENLQATQELLDIQRQIKSELQAQFLQEQRLLLTEQERAKISRQLQDAAKPSGQLALPSSQMLNAEGRGIRQLSPELGPAIDVGLQNARNFTQELVRAGQAGDQLPGIFSIVNQSLKGLVDTTQEQTLGLRTQRELLQDQLTLQNQLRALEAQRSKEARVKNQQAVDASPARQRARQEQDLLGVQNKRRAAEDKLRAQKLKEAGGNALIGGAFPLLFGQGLGASLGGGLGGAVGGLAGGQFGFGASLVGTAIGSAVDALNKRFADLATALLSPVESFNKLKEASVLASRAQDGYIQALIDSGRTAQAAKAIQDEAGKTIDPANALLLAGSTEVLSRAFSDLQDELGSFTSGAGQAFNTWLAQLIRTVAGRPGQNQPLTGPEAVRNAQNQRATGAGIGTLGLGIALAGATLATGGAALAIGGAGLALSGVGFGSALGANDKERVATSNEVAAAEEKVRSLLGEQIVTQQNINQAKALGLSKTAELIGISNQFQSAQVTAANQELQIQAQLAAGQITQSEAAKQLADVEAGRKITVESLVAKQQEAAAIAAVELQSAQALVGLKGQQRTIAQEQLKQEAAITQFVQARAAYQDRKASGLASPEELQALKAAADEAGSKLQTALITGADAIKAASEDARKNFESAAKSLQTTSESNFKFLTKDAQKQVLDRARQDIASGVQSGNIDQKFLNARKPEDIIAAANASRSQIQALDNFNKAAADYANAITQSNQTLGSVSQQLPEVSNNIVALQGSLDGLASKDWTVNVSVTGDSAANVRVD